MAQKKANEAYEKALQLLSRREYSRLELTQKLSAGGFSEQQIHTTINNLANNNHQSDARFAQAFVHMRIQQGKGSALIYQQLKQKGIEDYDLSEYDFFALAKTVKQKKYGDKPPKNYQQKAKQMRFLQSRGFSFEQINKAFENDR